MIKDFKVLFIYPNTMMATLLPLHVSVLSACLKEKGFHVELFDTTYYKTEEKSFEEKKVELLQIKKFNLENGNIEFKTTDIYNDLNVIVEEYKPDLIGITLVEDTYKLGLSLLKSIDKFNIPVIAGGVFVNFYAEELIKEDSIDMLCIGEGEHALVELCEAMSENRDYRSIKNLWIKEDDGSVIRNPLRELIKLDLLPYIDFDIFEPTRMCRPMQGRLFIMLHVEAQRGCPFDCTYCEAPAIRKLYKDKGDNGYFRQKSPERLISELKYLVVKYKPDYINFSAESFLAISIKELKKLAEMYKKEINLPFWCQSRPETVTEEKIKILKEMNCADMQFGIEHGNEEFRRKILNRSCSNKRMIEAIKIVEKYKIPYTVNDIIGFPGETRDLIFDTINFNRNLNPKTINCYMFTPYRGTYLRKYCVENGYLDKHASTMQLLDGADYKYDTITREELLGLQRTFSLYARFPESEFDLIKKAERFNEEGNQAFKKLSEVYYERFFK
ncbi:B12-binding domain-containing radical SAM protein [Candidatus Omnitrophota bacterium]